MRRLPRRHRQRPRRHRQRCPRPRPLLQMRRLPPMRPRSLPEADASMRLLPPLLFALFLLPLLGGPLHAQEAASAAPATPGPKPDSVSVDRANGYARILFTFATPTPVTSSVADG